MYAVILSERPLETTTGGCFTYDLIPSVLVTCLCHTSPQQLPAQPEFGAALWEFCPDTPAKSQGW